jgi:hypothetical protein
MVWAAATAAFDVAAAAVAAVTVGGPALDITTRGVTGVLIASGTATAVAACCRCLTSCSIALKASGNFSGRINNGSSATCGQHAIR